MSTPTHRVIKDDARCFIPEILVDFVTRSVKFCNKTELEPASYFFQGVCLLVDISGFTKLSEGFCTQGKSGIDDLQLATNGYMGKLVDVIYEFGGDIIKFAGDAIICVFSSELRTIVSTKSPLCGGSMRGHSRDVKRPTLAEFNPSSPSTTSVEVILRAMHCARVLREVQTENLSVHVAMSCGEMCFGILGGYDHQWECLISGPCIHELSACLDDAPSKQAVISSTCFEILRPHLPVPEYHTQQQGSVHMIETFVIGTDSGDYHFLLEALASGNHRIISVNYTSRSYQFGEPATASVHDTLVATRAEHNSLLAGPELHSHHLLPHLNLNHLIPHHQQQQQQGGVTHTVNRLLQPFVPVPVAIAEGPAAKGTGGLSYLAEIREVTTMFMKWDSYNAHGKHRDLMAMQVCFFETQKILHAAGAFVRQFLVDDKGCVLIACWGVPHLSYLDNALRALSSAAQIRYELEKLQMKCSFGITTGDVYCGTVGSALRMEYAAIGSVVNMAARLMCKANGNILIDDTTYARLPYAVLQYLHALGPLKVKGREEPLQVYQYTNKSPLAQVKEVLVVEDEEVKEEYKTLLLDFLQDIVRPAEPQRQRHQSLTLNRANLVDFLSSINPTVNTWNSTRTESMPIILLEGKEGLSRTSIVTWLRKQSAHLQLPTFAVKVTRKDSMLCYALWAKLFQQLMPRDLFQDKPTQRRYVQTLLKEVYSAEELSMVESVVFPVIRAALGVTCSYDCEDPQQAPSARSVQQRSYQRPSQRKGMMMVLSRNRASAGAAGRGAADSKSFTLRNSKFSRPIDVSRAKPTAILPGAATTTTSVWKSVAAVEITSTLVVETLKRIFTHLLTWRTVLVVIENIHFADAESLQVLLELTNIRTRSALVLTAALNPADEISKSPHSRRAVVPKLLRWVKHTRQRLLECSNTRRVALQDYTRVDVDRMLAGALGVPLSLVPPDVSQLIVDFSGGSFYWMKEILQFIREHGPDEFLSTIEDMGLDPRCRGKRPSPGTSARISNNAPLLRSAISTLTSSSAGCSSSASPSPLHSTRSVCAGQLCASPSTVKSKNSSSALSLATLGSISLPSSPGLPTALLQRQLSGGALRRRSLSRFSGRTAATATASGANLRRCSTAENILRSVARNSKNKFKLEQLVVCRFEKLASKMQQIFRTASIIGITFSARVLYGVLPRHLKTDMTECIHSLLAQKWLFQDTDDEYMYHFAHPYLHGVIYELTPTGERNSVHQVIAEYIEETSVHDPSQYVLVAHHYQYCNPDQSLRYAVYAIQHLLRLQNTGAVELEDCLDLLCGALPCCKTVLDFDVMRAVIAQMKCTIVELDQELRVSSAKCSWIAALGKMFTLPTFGNCTRNNSVRPDAYTPAAAAEVAVELSAGDADPDADVDSSGDQGVEQEQRLMTTVMHCFMVQLQEVGRQVAEKSEDLLHLSNSPARATAGRTTRATRAGRPTLAAGSSVARVGVGKVSKGDALPGAGAGVCVGTVNNSSTRDTGLNGNTQSGKFVPWQKEFLTSVLPRETRLSVLLNANVNLFRSNSAAASAFTSNMYGHVWDGMYI